MSVRWRLSVWYLLVLAAIGSLNPWLAVLLEDAGADGKTKAAILALFSIAVLTTGPLGAWVADRTGRPARVLRMGVVLTAVGSVWLVFASSLAAMAAAVALVAFTRAPLPAITDMYTVDAAGLGKDGYGRIRAVGSVGFIVAALGVGATLDAAPSSPLWISAAAMVALVAVTAGLPERPRARPEGASLSLGPLLRHRVLLPLYVVAVLHRGTIGFYDSFFALHVLESLQLPGWVPGCAFAVGVGAEVGVLAAGHALLARFGPWKLVAAAVAVGVPRYWLTGMVSDPALLIGIQAAHGLGFGAWWVGAIALVSRHAPDELRNSAQGLLSAAGMGIGTLLAMAMAALLLDRGTGAAFQWVAAVSAVGVLVVVAWLGPALRRAR